ncbi:N,N-dimethylformamidase beta subunit family domain-containing protein [Phytomonospora endophytica]|uniref:N,N-dimethylformamidase beta subunit-like C-terminal domain-containing protein n=1 Tax=Phytomonospora endophytica TaxID=714109 RepID=A0A841FU84_9ACTN|nr:N,N-dimethylformamidase beta subunit family domain-containing protein [Phytomonospora endophytica]MBB6035520.1 hypothetical protein [Phytomonospora endophytica]GIG63729.1 hypothetical protein Pen01_00240 [Phytomonospora endophytica]
MGRGAVYTRRAALTVLGAGALAVAAGEAIGRRDALPVRPAAKTGANVLVDENTLAGTPGWEVGADGTVAADDVARQIQGYASATSVGHGETIGFHVAVAAGHDFGVGVYRLGHYGGVGARLVAESPSLGGKPGALPSPDPVTGMVSCDWPVSWAVTVGADWRSGMYLAVFTAADGHRSCTPFVVREPERASDILVVAPVTTHQAYNIWPMDGVNGKSFYKGYDRHGRLAGMAKRAVRVSFDRPYAGAGLPLLFELDVSFARWAEEHGYDVTYATSIDLHEGRVDPEKYTVMVFPGHDEYWSKPMRDLAERARRRGTHQAYLAANSMYWHVRLEASADGRAGRVVTCYKERDVEDPAPDEHGPTVRWRTLEQHHAAAEQGFLGVQYNGIPVRPVPLVVREAGHWFWEGTGLRDGDEIPGLVTGEADGFDPDMPKPRKSRQTLLSASPYMDDLGRGRRVQNSSLVLDEQGTTIFVAGTYGWSLALYEPAHRNRHVRVATTNVFERMLGPRE